MTRGDFPVSLRSALDVEELSHRQYCDEVYFLGSFWPHSNQSFESRVVKGFKECFPASLYEPYSSRIARFYCGKILERFAQQDFDWVVRVMSSAETVPDQQRPLAVLVSVLCSRLGARDCTQVFFRTNSRPPMRAVERLSGGEALRSRIRYAAEDLFVRPKTLGGRALLVDDIANTGASMRVYAFALKAFAGIDSVVAVNLAATRFANGKDGRGMLTLDTSELESEPGLSRVFLDSSNSFHLEPDCRARVGSVSVEMRFLAERRVKPCPICAKQPPPKGLLGLFRLWK
ncbi:MAG: phosphoribosyltransferase [Armatimonadota bacterium]|nr:phosphoribosyltransferase [Armatimonadota bacterium]